MSFKRAEHWIFLATKKRRVQDFPYRYTFPFHELGTTLTRKVSFLPEKHVSWHLQQETVFCNPLLQLFIRRSFLGTTAKNREVFRTCQKFIKRDEIFDEGNAIFAKTGEVVGSLKARQLQTEKSGDPPRKNSAIHRGKLLRGDYFKWKTNDRVKQLIRILPPAGRLPQFPYRRLNSFHAEELTETKEPCSHHGIIPLSVGGDGRNNKKK